MTGVFSPASLVRISVTAIWKVTIAQYEKRPRNPTPNHRRIIRVDSFH